MKLLVTGGAGFIGSNFIHYWLDKYSQDEIVNLDKITYAGNLENLRDVEGNNRYEFVEGDICDRGLVRQLMEDVDVVVNFAAESHVDRSIEGPRVFVQTNIVGTQVLLDAALELGIERFHQISTDEVYGSLELSDPEKFTEDAPYAPHSPYSASKAAADHLVRAYYHTYDLPVTITNCSNNFGPYQHPEKVISLFVTNLLEDKKVPLYGDGKNVRDWLFVEDHCRAIDLVLKKGEVGETYLVGGGNELSNIELTKKILEVMGKDESYIEYVEDRPGHDRRYAIDFSKIKSELGWEPEYSFEQALKKTVEWYRTNREWWLPLKRGV
ncbi:MAG: dTDP-glucose 4,6-dehydratase [Patescibacteria group bacterium]|nr:dTDP-glucose 4,6-dehydratase [Patescibacteria group bacterium]